jgi:DNA invertase Pin-like site-specific DNA recombinase
MASAILPRATQDPKSLTGRTYGYVRATPVKDVKGPEAQAEIIATYCRRIGRRLDDVFCDDAPSGGLPLAEREGGKNLRLNLRKGDHIVAARFDLMFRSTIEFGKTLGVWAKLGVVVHFCDVPAGPLDPEDPLTRHLIDLLVLFNASRSRRIATRCRAVSDRLKAEGRRNSRFAPFGFKWERRGQFWFLAPEPNEQPLCIQAAKMRLEGYSWHQIRRYFAYEWKVRNRRGNQFGYTEIREMTFRGLELLKADGSLDGESSPSPRVCDSRVQAPSSAPLPAC